MMASQVLKILDFTRTQKSRYLENETLFFLQINKFINQCQGLLNCKKKFCSEGNL